MTPCPVALFTLGWLLLLRSPVKWWVTAIPVAWSLIGGTAAFLLEVPQNWVLLASGPERSFFLQNAEHHWCAGRWDIWPVRYVVSWALIRGKRGQARP